MYQSTGLLESLGEKQILTQRKIENKLSPTMPQNPSGVPAKLPNAFGGKVPSQTKMLRNQDKKSSSQFDPIGHVSLNLQSVPLQIKNLKGNKKIMNERSIETYRQQRDTYKTSQNSPAKEEEESSAEDTRSINRVNDQPKNIKMSLLNKNGLQRPAQYQSRESSLLGSQRLISQNQSSTLKRKRSFDDFEKALAKQRGSRNDTQLGLINQKQDYEEILDESPKFKTKNLFDQMKSINQIRMELKETKSSPRRHAFGSAHRREFSDQRSTYANQNFMLMSLKDQMWNKVGQQPLMTQGPSSLQQKNSIADLKQAKSLMNIDFGSLQPGHSTEVGQTQLIGDETASLPVVAPKQPNFEWYEQHMMVWDSEDSASDKSQQSNRKAESEQENVSDDNMDEDEIQENNLLYGATLSTHLENGQGIRLKNSFQQQKGSEHPSSRLRDQMQGSAQDLVYSGVQTSAPQFNLDEYQDTDQMVRDLLKFHKIETEATSLLLIERINDGLSGVAMKRNGRSAAEPEMPNYRSQPKKHSKIKEQCDGEEIEHTYDDLGISDEEQGADHQTKKLTDNKVGMNLHILNDYQLNCEEEKSIDPIQHSVASISNDMPIQPTKQASGLTPGAFKSSSSKGQAVRQKRPSTSKVIVSYLKNGGSPPEHSSNKESEQASQQKSINKFKSEIQFNDHYFPPSPSAQNRAQNVIQANFNLSAKQYSQTRNTAVQTKRGSYLNHEQNLDDINHPNLQNAMSPPLTLPISQQDEPDLPSEVNLTLRKEYGPSINSNMKVQLTNISPYQDLDNSMNPSFNTAMNDLDENSPTPKTLNTVKIKRKLQY